MTEARVVLNYVNRKGYERDCEVEVDFTIVPGGWQDAEDEIQIISSRVIGDYDLDEWTFSEMLYEAVAEWCADNPDEVWADYTDRQCA